MTLLNDMNGTNNIEEFILSNKRIEKEPYKISEEIFNNVMINEYCEEDEDFNFNFQDENCENNSVNTKSDSDSDCVYIGDNLNEKSNKIQDDNMNIKIINTEVTMGNPPEEKVTMTNDKVALTKVI